MLINKDRVVNRFLNYIKINSETKSEKDFALYLKAELEELGFVVVIDNAGESFGGNCGNLIAKLKGEISGGPILFSGHMDTVSPGINIKPIIKDDIIYSDGSTILGGDDKAGIAAIVEGIVTILESGLPHNDLELLFTVAEEGGLKGSKNLDLSLITAKQGYILDSSKLPGEIITNAPAQAKINVTVNGKASHAGVCPENGISAIQVLSSAITGMKLLRIDEETTANIGIVNGGSATNIVMPKLEVVAEVRSLSVDKLNAQINHMKDCFEKAANEFNTTVDFESVLMYGAFNIEETAEVVNNAKAAYKALDIEAYTTFTGGGSDANVLNDRGLEIINLGIGEKQAHTLGEHYYIRDLLLVSEFVTELIKLHANLSD